MNCCICKCSFGIEGVPDQCGECKQFICENCFGAVLNLPQTKTSYQEINWFGQKAWITTINSCKSHTIVQCVGCQKNDLPSSWCTECDKPLCAPCVEKTNCIFDTDNKVFMTKKCSFHRNVRFNQSNVSSFPKNILPQPPSYDVDLPPPYS